MAITAGMVKELREMTGAGMMDCKKALTATDGDMDKAVEFLREKGLATAQKKAGRIAAEGIVMLKVTEDSKKAVAVEVNAETDFVAKNEKFQDTWRRYATRPWRPRPRTSTLSWQSPGSLTPPRPLPRNWQDRFP